MTERTADESGSVTRLPTAQPDSEPIPPSPARGVHAVATGTMALCAVVGIALTLLLVTVNWTPYSRRIVVVALVGVTVLFVASAAIAVFAGARATYRPQTPLQGPGDD